MLPSFIGILDIQSWWEVPSIAYFCSLFRAAFNLLDFDIEELEEALLTDGTEDSSNSLLTELIVRLLSGCLGSNEISAFNYQMYLRRLFRQKCQETGRNNPFDSDIDFQFLPLRTKVEILYALCDFRLDAEDVFELFKNLEADSLRVEPLGWDDNQSAYWYFYGTRLYREDFKKAKGKKKKSEKKKYKRSDPSFLDWEDSERVWQVICFTESDWTHLTEKFKNASSQVEKELYQSLSQNFLPEIPRLFQEKERLQRKRLLDSVPRRTSSRVLQKVKRDEDIGEQSPITRMDIKPKIMEDMSKNRESRSKRKRESDRSASISSDNRSIVSDRAPSLSPRPEASQAKKKRKKRRTESWKPPEIPLITGRKTNNSLSSSLGQFMIPEDIDNVKNKTKSEKSQLQSQEEIETDMYKILEQLTAHEDAWPFMDPVEEEYAPNYYAVIRRPMDLKKMEKRLEEGYYTDFRMFENDFKLIVNNCRLYNGQDNEYTAMVDNLQNLFDRLTTKYATKLFSSDDEKSEQSTMRHSKKRKSIDSKSHGHKVKRRKSSHQEDGDDAKERHKNSKHEHREKKQRSKDKRKHKGHRKERRNSKSKHKHHKNSKKKQRREKSKSVESDLPKVDFHSSFSSFDDMDCSRSPSPLPSIHTLSPSPPPSLSDKSNCGDSADKLKDIYWQSGKDSWDSLVDYRKPDTDKQNVKIFEIDKNPKLRETIEKLKAKNESLHERSLFNELFLSDSKKDSDSLLSFKSSLSKGEDTSSQNSFIDTANNKKKTRKCNKKESENCVKNESTSEALEQAVKDIAMWLDDTPRNFKKTENTVTEPELTDLEAPAKENALLKDDKKLSEKSEKTKQSSKKRDIQRTIERLQPGKSKGNLLTNAPTKEKEPLKEVKEENEPPLPTEEVIVPKGETNTTLQLGSVLPTDKFGLGTNHNFEENKVVAEKTSPVLEIKQKTPEKEEKKTEKINTMKDVSTETARDSPRLSQEKATPNLSAWFKAFGAPKSTGGPTKKNEEDISSRSVGTILKTDTFTDEIAETLDRSVSPVTVPASTKQRRTSTGSSVSERSSFSQDLDSPRHLVPHSSPLLRSPASPRNEDIQKAYSIVNGTVRAGFYQDTTSVKSSPEKSCSPREAPSSPHTSQHVYANCNPLTPSSNNVDQTKSIFSTYAQSQTAYYENVDSTNRILKPGETFTTTPTCQSQNTNNSTKEYPSHGQHFSYFSQNIQGDDGKSSLFPVKKRYNESTQCTADSYQESSINKTSNIASDLPTYKCSTDTSYLDIINEGRISDLSIHKSDPQSAENLKITKSKGEDKAPKTAIAKSTEKIAEKAELSKTFNSDVNKLDYSIDKFKRTYQETSTSESNISNLYSKHYEMQNMEMNYSLPKTQSKNAYSEINKSTKNVEMSQRRHDYASQMQDYENAHNEYNFFNELLMRGNSNLPQSVHGLDYNVWKNDSITKEKEQLNKLYNTAVTDYSKVQKNIGTTNANIYSRPSDNYYGASSTSSTSMTNTSQCELRIPNPRGLSTNNYTSPWVHSPKSDAPSRTTNTKYDNTKNQKYPAMTTFQNTPSYPLALDSFRNIPNLPQMIERYAAEEKYLNPSNSSVRSDMLQMTNKNLPMNDNAKSYVQTSVQEKYAYSKTPDEAGEVKKKGRKTKATELKQRTTAYPNSSTADLSGSVKGNVSSSAFNFSAGVPIETGLYGDNSAFSLDGLRSSATNQLMAANYMAAVAHQRMNQDSNLDKTGKSNPQSGTYTFPSLMRHPQVRSTYPFVGSDPASPIYQQYLQRHQEELLRHTGAQIMGLYPDFSGSLGIHQPFDSINRPSWL